FIAFATSGSSLHSSPYARAHRAHRPRHATEGTSNGASRNVPRQALGFIPEARGFRPAPSVPRPKGVVMPRAPTGAVVEHVGKDGRMYRALRFSAYGKRRFVLLGAVSA